MLNVRELFAAAARQTAKENRRFHHRIGPGRQTWHTEHRALRGINYGVAFCGGKQECERRLKTRQLLQWEAGVRAHLRRQL